MLELTNPCILSNFVDFHAPWTLKKPSDRTLTEEGMTSGIYMLIASLFFSVLQAVVFMQTRSGSHSIFANNSKWFGSTRRVESSTSGNAYKSGTWLIIEKCKLN